MKFIYRIIKANIFLLVFSKVIILRLSNFFPNAYKFIYANSFIFKSV